MKNNNLVKYVVISGYDYNETEQLAEMIAKHFGMNTTSIIYIPEKVYREDNMTCHMIGSYDKTPAEFRYLMMREADLICARTYIDACRNFDWLRPEGIIRIGVNEPDGKHPRFPQERARRFLELQEEVGYVRRIIHCQSYNTVV